MMIEAIRTYLQTQPLGIQDKLLSIHNLIHTLCPEVEESISYGMPAYTYHKRPLIYFAAFTHHIGLYATPTAHKRFSDELAGYKQGKGSVQFPIDQPLPLGLISDMIIFNMKEIENKMSK